MFTLNTTEGFNAADIDLLNAAVSELVAKTGMDEKNAVDIVNNNWQEHGNTVESLSAT